MRLIFFFYPFQLKSSHGTAKAKLNLVPEYNSDDSDDENAEPLEKPLFPSSKNAIAINNQPIKTIELSKDENNEPNHTARDSNNSLSPKNANSTVANAKAKYANFQKGETEFAEQHTSNSSDAVKRAPIDEQQNLEAKLNFLCQGREDVSPVQVIQIQLQVSIDRQTRFIFMTIIYDCKICRLFKRHMWLKLCTPTTCWNG